MAWSGRAVHCTRQRGGKGAGNGRAEEGIEPSPGLTRVRGAVLWRWPPEEARRAYCGPFNLWGRRAPCEGCAGLGQRRRRTSRVGSRRAVGWQALHRSWGRIGQPRRARGQAVSTANRAGTTPHRRPRPGALVSCPPPLLHLTLRDVRCTDPAAHLRGADLRRGHRGYLSGVHFYCRAARRPCKMPTSRPERG